MSAQHVKHLSFLHRFSFHHLTSAGTQMYRHIVNTPTHMHHSCYPQMKTHVKRWQQLIHMYTHSCVILLSNVSPQMPPGVLGIENQCIVKHTHQHIHTLWAAVETVGSLVRVNNSGSDGQATECLVARAEGYPSMASAASSPPHTNTHTANTHTTQYAILSANRPGPPPLPVCSDRNMIAHSHHGGGKGGRIQSGETTA